MVRHTHRRRQSRSRRRNTRRSRRTQRGGYSLFGFGEVTAADIQKKQAALQQNPTNLELKKDLDLDQAKLVKQTEEENAKKKYEAAVKRIEEGGAALSSTSVNTNVNRDINGRFQSPANAAGAAATSNGNGTGNMFGGGRRRRSHRRR